MSTTRTIAMTVAAMATTLAVASCAGKPAAVPESYFHGTALDRNPVTARSTTEVLEVALNPADSQLRRNEVYKLKAFLADYNARGHGPLLMVAPKGGENPQLAVDAVAEARQMAWEAGIEYSQISGSAYAASSRPGGPLILAFTAYDALAPDCPMLSEMDFANATSNSDLPTLGCAVRTNMAAMIADPADLYGQRGLDASDTLRRELQLEKWRTGEPTGAERSDEESGAVSTAVN